MLTLSFCPLCSEPLCYSEISPFWRWSNITVKEEKIWTYLCSHRGFWDGGDEAPRRNDSAGPQLRRQPGGPHVHAAPRHQHQQPVEAACNTGEEVLPAGRGKTRFPFPHLIVSQQVHFQSDCLTLQEDEGGVVKQAAGQDGGLFKAPAVVKTKASSIIMNSLITSKLELL